VLEKIRIDDPAGKLADDATLLAGNAQYKRGNYLEADQFYTDLRRNFPDSEHQFRAHVLGLQCKFQIYQGPDYDQTPLVEAEKLVKTIRRQFPQESEKEIKFLEESFKEVRKRKALAEWELAQYYDAKAEYRAAKHHYDRVVKDYSDTSLAEAARTRVTEIAGLPPVPENRFAWLTDRFSRQEDEKSSYGTGPAPTKLR
jgi:outer membrane protein assembly factor BamD (BamD/ComL family)